MVAKGPRNDSGPNREVRRYDAELHDDPPIIIWQVKPNTGGIQVAVFIHDPTKPLGRKPATKCACNLYGSPRRKAGPHHDEDCGRYVAA